MYVQLNHFAVHLKLTQYCKLTMLQLKKKKKDSLRNYPSLEEFKET